MRYRALAVALAAFVLYSGEASAGWAYIATSDGIRHFTEDADIARNGDSVFTWTRMDFPSSVPVPGKGSSGKTYLKQHNFVLYDCFHRTWRTLRIQYYDALVNARIVESVEIGYDNAQERMVTKGSVGNDLLDYSCSHKGDSWFNKP
jgi:hypothetical protein